MSSVLFGYLLSCISFSSCFTFQPMLHGQRWTFPKGGSSVKIRLKKSKRVNQNYVGAGSYKGTRFQQACSIILYSYSRGVIQNHNFWGHPAVAPVIMLKVLKTSRVPHPAFDKLAEALKSIEKKLADTQRGLIDFMIGWPSGRKKSWLGAGGKRPYSPPSLPALKQCVTSSSPLVGLISLCITMQQAQLMHSMMLQPRLCCLLKIEREHVLWWGKGDPVGFGLQEVGVLWLSWWFRPRCFAG